MLGALGACHTESLSVLLCACKECVLLCACMQCHHESKGEGWEGTASVCYCVHAWDVCSCVQAVNFNMRAKGKAGKGQHQCALVCMHGMCALVCMHAMST